MSLDLFCATASQSPAGVPLQQSCHDASSFRSHLFREAKRVMENALVHEVDVLVIKGWKTGHHLVQEDAQSPPIDRFVVPLTFE